MQVSLLVTPPNYAAVNQDPYTVIGTVNDLQKIPNTGISSMLQGMAAGAQVLQNSGQPERKYEVSDDQYCSNMSHNAGPTNFPNIRFGDVILMAVEAAFKTDDESKAPGYVNQIRLRARNGAATSEPTDLTSICLEDILHNRQPFPLPIRLSINSDR